MAVSLLPSAVELAVGLQRGLAIALQSSTGEDDDPFLFLVIGFGIGLYLLYKGFDTWRLSRLVEDTPTSKVRSMSVGRVELEGTARKREESVTPPLLDEECVYVEWEAEKREHRPADDHGSNYEWVTIGRGTHALAFDLEDDTGSVLIRADLDDPTFDINQDGHQLDRSFDSGEAAPDDVRRFVRGEGNPGGVSLAEQESGGLVDSVTDFATDLATDSLDDTGNKRRYSETVLPVDTDAYVFGSAEPRDGAAMESSESDLLEVRRHDGTDRFLISDSTEEALQDSYGKWGPLMILAGLVVSAGALYFLLTEYQLHQLLG